MKNNAKKLIMPALSGVKTHPHAIFFNTPKFIALPPPLARPMPITAPTTAWELETGTRGIAGRPWVMRKRSRLSDANINKTRDSARTTTRALMGESLNISLPTVFITRRE